MNSGRLLAILAPVYCAAGVALGAYASHADVTPFNRERLGLAALFAFGHGLGLIALEQRGARLALIARWALAVGVTLFSGSLALAALAGLPPVAAPLGGMAMIAGWLLVAMDAARRAATLDGSI